MNTITEVFYRDQDYAMIKIRADHRSGLKWDLVMHSPSSELITHRVILADIPGSSQVIQIMDLFLNMLFAEGVIAMDVRNDFIEAAKHAMAWYENPRQSSE